VKFDFFSRTVLVGLQESLKQLVVKWRCGNGWSYTTSWGLFK